MKYKGQETISTLEVFIDEMDAVPVNFWRHCSVHHIAVLLDIRRETIYDWRNKFPEFSNTIKKWEEKRDALFLELKNKNGAWIFLAKNWLGMTDKQEMEHSGGVSIKYISHIPQPDKKPDEKEGND